VSEGDAPLVLELRSSGARSDARFRLVAAILVAPASLYVLSASAAPVSRALGLAGLLVSIGWAAAYARAVRGPVAPRRTLLVSSVGIALETGGTRDEVAWSDILDIDLDDDAATLVIRRASGPELRIEPGYGDLDAIGLHRILLAHRHGANLPTHG
jgi:hypothetical protein